MLDFCRGRPFAGRADTIPQTHIGHVANTVLLFSLPVWRKAKRRVELWAQHQSSRVHHLAASFILTPGPWEGGLTLAYKQSMLSGCWCSLRPAAWAGCVAVPVAGGQAASGKKRDLSLSDAAVPAAVLHMQPEWATDAASDGGQDGPRLLHAEQGPSHDPAAPALERSQGAGCTAQPAWPWRRLECSPCSATSRSQPQKVARTGPGRCTPSAGPVIASRQLPASLPCRCAALCAPCSSSWGRWRTWNSPAQRATALRGGSGGVTPDALVCCCTAQTPKVHPLTCTSQAQFMHCAAGAPEAAPTLWLGQI